MEHFISTTLLLCAARLVSAQAECTGGRYLYPPSFDSVEVVTGIPFGSNASVAGGGPQTLYMDVYKPVGDTQTDRPVVIAAFGGSFIAGQRADVAPICEQFARLGYVAVAPDYRVGFFFPNSNTTQLAVTRAMHDLRGCIRFLRRSVAEEGDPYGIDPERIIVGGVSAGAIGAVQVAYLDENSEIPEVLYDDTLSIGGLEGNSGSAGYDSSPLAVWSMSGAIGDTSWIHPGDEPLISLHEIADEVVPYGTQEVSVIGIPTGLIASGSRDIHARMDHIGVPNCLTTYPGDGHVGYLTTDPDNAMGRVAAFLADVVCAQDIACGNLATNVSEPHKPSAFSAQPSPFTHSITITSDQARTLEMRDCRGRKIHMMRVRTGVNELIPGELAPGIYFLSEPGVPGGIRLVKE